MPHPATLFPCRLLLCTLLLTLFALPVYAAATPAVQDKTVHIGLLAPRGDLIARQKWQPTLNWLEARIPGSHFQLHPLNLNNMNQAVQQQKMDFIITNPGQAVQLGRQFELSWIATLTRPDAGSQGVGSALVVKADAPYTSLQDLYGQPIAAVSRQAFGGYLTLHYSLLEQGLDPERFLADLRFLGYPVDAGLYQLRDEVVQAAIVPVCLLEEMNTNGLLDAGQYRVLAETADDYRCRSSTRLYPNWSIARTAHGSAELAKQIGQALLALPAGHEAARALAASGWTPPVSHLAVDQLYETLDLHPLMRPFSQQVWRWLNAHRDWAFMLLAALVLMAVYHFWLQVRFSRSQGELTRTLTALAEKQSQLEHAQRIAVVGELGSSVAHEINQPLSAIRNFAESARLRLDKQAPAEKISPLVAQIFAQLDRTDAIIQRLRHLIKKPEVSYQPCPLAPLILDCCAMLDHQLKQQGIRCTLEWPAEAEGKETAPNDDLTLALDRVGLQQVFVNLLGNAIDACSDYAGQKPEPGYQGQIRIQIRPLPGQVQICVLDNGTGLKLDGYPKPFLTTKADGLGLGLAISRDIVERHGGTLRIRDLDPHGCAVTLELPGPEATEPGDKIHATGRL